MGIMKFESDNEADLEILQDKIGHLFLDAGFESINKDILTDERGYRKGSVKAYINPIPGGSSTGLELSFSHWGPPHDDIDPKEIINSSGNFKIGEYKGQYSRGATYYIDHKILN